MSVTIGGAPETLTVVDHQGPKVSVSTLGQMVTIDAVERVVRVAVQGIQGPPGPAGSGGGGGGGAENLALTYADDDRIDLVTGETFTKTMGYSPAGRLETITFDSGGIHTLTYGPTGLLTGRVIT